MFLLIDKPKGMTSHDVVDEVRKITAEKKVGHAGTLDPNATGLLVVGVGRESTKRLGKLAKDTEKTYEAKICLGEERDTDDAEGEPQDQVGNAHIAKSGRGDNAGMRSLPALSKDNVIEVLRGFVGEQDQVPPKFSAVRVGGRRAYKLARKGRGVNLNPRRVVIYSIDLLSYKYPKMKLEVKVSSGTYIRSIARDVGRKLGCGAYLGELRRTKIGEFDVGDAVALDRLEDGDWRDYCIEDI